MAVTLSDLKSAVLSNLGAVTGDVSGTDLSRHINRVYQHDIPLDIGGQSSRVEWYILTTATDDGSYQFPDNLVALNGTVLRDDDELVVYTDYQAFYQAEKRETTTATTAPARGKPQSALIWGRELIVRPQPDAAYDLFAEGTGVRDVLDSDSAEILDPTERYAIEAGATIYVALMLGEDETAARYTDMRAYHFQLLNRQDAKGRIVPVTRRFDF